MPVRSLFPILLTRDLDRLADFYGRALGATVAYRFENAYVSLAFGDAAGDASLGIGWAPDAATDGDRVSLWFYVDDVDGVYAAFVAAGGASVDEPADMPWGERVARVRDVDGNLVNLGAEPAAA